MMHMKNTKFFFQKKRLMWNFTINDSISLATKNIKLCVSVNFCLPAGMRKHCARTQTIALPLAGWRGNGRLEIWTMKSQGIPSTWLMSLRNCWKRGKGSVAGHQLTVP